MLVMIVCAEKTQQTIVVVLVITLVGAKPAQQIIVVMQINMCR